MAAGRREAAQSRSDKTRKAREALIGDVAKILAANPGASLRQLARALEEAEIPTPAGRLNWNPTGVARLLTQLQQAS